MMTQEKVDMLYKETEEPGKILVGSVILDNPLARRLITSWSGLKKTFDETAELGEKSIWDFAEFSYDEWLNITGLPPSENNFKLAETIVQCGYVFPDGRVHAAIMQAFRVFLERDRRHKT